MISQKIQSKEEVFLQTAAMLYNYRQCGSLPLHNKAVSIVKSDDEEKLYATNAAHQVLNDIVETGSISLLNFWLEQCRDGNKIVQPEIIPVLLNAGMKNKQLQSLVYSCCGKRGIWLVQFNEEWKFTDTKDKDEVWETGTLEQRKDILGEIRKTDPSRGRELLQQTWQKENAATKTELIKQLSINSGKEDVPWLEELLNEKSIKVKEEVLQVLKTISSSSVVQKYWNILQQSIKLTTARGLLGIGTKTNLEVKLISFDEAIFKTGIQQLSGNAKITDENFILYQLISSVPPHLWETHFNLDNKKIIDLFSKNENYKTFMGAFGLAASRFKNLAWLRTIIAIHENSLHLDAFSLLPQKEAEDYALSFLTTDDGASSILHIIRHFSKEWGIEFSKAVLKFTSKNPYQYNKSFYNEIIHLLPGPMAFELEKFKPQEEQLEKIWNNLSEHISKLIALKLQTLKTFKE